MNEYNLTAFVKERDFFQEPRPHRIWWRRLFGQTESQPISGRYVNYIFSAPPDIIHKQWFQDFLRNFLGNDAKFIQLECNDNIYLYHDIKNNVDIFIEKQRTNLVRRSETFSSGNWDVDQKD